MAEVVWYNPRIMKNTIHSVAAMAVLAAAVVAAHVAQARTFTVGAWRGETVAAQIPDFVELGEAPAGISLKFGVMKSVKYAPLPNSVQRLECFDRVVWGQTSGGPRVVEVSVPADAKPGTYNCGALSVKVVDRVLPPPKDWEYFLDLWQHPWAVARMAGVKPFSKEHYAAMRPVYELLATAGQKALTVTILDEPWDHQCRDAYHSMVDDADFRTFDEYVEFGRSCGIGPVISCYSLCPWALKVSPGTKEFEEHWAPFMKRFVAHLEKKGWLKDTVMAMDERSPEQVKAVVEFVKKHAPGLRISMAGNRKPSDFDGIDIDIYSQVLSHVTPDFLAEIPSRRARGFVTTHYVCCGPIYPNTFMSSGAGEAFWLGVSPAMLGLDGFLRWAWNSWPENPVEDASYWNWRAGDTFLVYPGGEPSWRFLELRNGIAAAEKVRIMRRDGILVGQLDALAKRFVVKEAVVGKSDYAGIRRATLELVNRDK